MAAKYNLFNFITYNKFEVYKDEGNFKYNYRYKLPYGRLKSATLICSPLYCLYPQIHILCSSIMPVFSNPLPSSTDAIICERV